MGFLACNHTGGSSMAHVMRSLAGLFFVLLLAAMATAQVQVEPVKPEPAWCGGPYSVTGGLGAQAYRQTAAEGARPSGTDLGESVAIERPFPGLQGEWVV